MHGKHFEDPMEASIGKHLRQRSQSTLVPHQESFFNALHPDGLERFDMPHDPTPAFMLHDHH